MQNMKSLFLLLTKPLILYKIKSMMKKTFFSFLIVFLSVFCLAITANAMTFRIDQPSIKIKAAQGQVKTGEIAIENTSGDIVNVRAYVQDWAYVAGGDGTKNFSPPATTSLSCAQWLHIYPETFELPPYGRQMLQYTITVPQEAVGGHFAVIFFETYLGKAKNEDGAWVNVAARIASLIYQETEGTTIRKGEITRLSVSPADEDKKLDIELEFKNTGNINIATEGYFDIIDKNGNVFAHAPLNNTYTLPGDIAKTKVSWSGGLSLGEYDLIITLDVGDNEVIVREEKIIVKRSAKVGKISVDLNNNRIAVNAGIINDGNLNITSDLKAEIIGRDSQVIDTLYLNNLSVFPHTTKEVKFEFKKKLSRNSYKARLSFAVDGQMQSGEENFSIE